MANVYVETLKRIELIFKEFDNVYVSFSGGKDSGVLLNLCIEYIKANKLNRKIGVFHMDYEAQYQMTTDYVKNTFEQFKEHIEVYHICLPLAAQCSTSMYQSYWIPWEKEKQDIWVRDMPESCINEDNHEFDFFVKGTSDYDLQVKFSNWIHNKKQAKRTCCLVGIRTQESFNRWRAVYSDKNYKKYRMLKWTKEVYPNVYNAYPIYDWKVEDVWIANGKFKWDYNRLYDLFYQAGLTVNQMRVASPFNDCAAESLKLYKVIDPLNWGKMIGRVNGVNFTGIYGGTTAMGWRSIKLPKGQTWKSYLEFLLNTLPEETRNNYKKKLEISEKFWKEKGGCLSEEVIKKLSALNINFETVSETNYNTDKTPVKLSYLDDIDIDEFRDIPTYKRMCICIMKNDHTCKYMGFSLTKNEQEKKEKALKMYKNI